MTSLSTPFNDCQSSETTITDDTIPDRQIDSPNSLTAASEHSNKPEDGEEQALDSHQVIELQKFSERKAWIEEKIKVKSSSPPSSRCYNELKLHP